MKPITYTVTIFMISVIGLSTAVHAVSLSKKDCKALKLQKNAMVKQGAAKPMAKGASWAKTNLSEEGLKKVKSYIDISEQLLFRCGYKKMRYVDLNNKPVPREQLQLPPKPVKKKKVVKKKTTPKKNQQAAKAK